MVAASAERLYRSTGAEQAMDIENDASAAADQSSEDISANALNAAASTITARPIALEDIRLGFWILNAHPLDKFDALYDIDELANAIRESMASLEEIQSPLADIGRIAAAAVSVELAEQDAMNALLRDKAEAIVKSSVNVRQPIGPLRERVRWGRGGIRHATGPDDPSDNPHEEYHHK